MDISILFLLNVDKMVDKVLLSFLMLEPITDIKAMSVDIKESSFSNIFLAIARSLNGIIMIVSYSLYSIKSILTLPSNNLIKEEGFRFLIVIDAIFLLWVIPVILLFSIMFF